MSTYDYDDMKVTALDIEIPEWISQDITTHDIAAITMGGCAFGAYMPAVTYHEAIETMNEHGDDVFQYIEDSLGEIPQPEKGFSWAGLAVFYLSTAVELWASAVENEVLEALRNYE